MNAQELQECTDLTNALNNEYVQLVSKVDECTDTLESSEYEKNIIKLNKKIKELRAENSVRSTTSEYFLGTLIFVGFVMFLYAVYISLYSSSLF